MLVLNLNRQSKVPLHKQVFTLIQEMIEGNTLKPGTKLPSTREFAQKNGISRTVAYNAYEELWGQGYVESRPGSYTFVRDKKPNIKLQNRAEKSLIDWEETVTTPCREVHDIYSNFPELSYETEKTDILSMNSLSLDHRILPVDNFRKCLNTAIRKDPGIFNYGKVEGYLPLRSFIASRLKMHGVEVTPEEIMITNGTQNSIDLVLRLLAGPGSMIVTENPTFLYAPPLMKLYNANVVGVSMNQNGMDLDELEKILRSCKPSFIYTIPNFQNPSGITMSPEVREGLIAISENYKVPIVEDAFEEEMKYFGRVPLPVKSMDKNQLVIYLSSFSKVLFPGMRIGWIAADKKLLKIASSMKTFSDIATNSVIQAGLYEFCQQGYYDMHIKHMHRIYKRRMQTALQALREKLIFDQVSWHEPLGGYLIWLKLEGLVITEDELHNVLLRHKIQTTPGSWFFTKQKKSHHIRLSITQVNEEEIIEGIERLRSAFEELYTRHNN
ncbi:MAG: PLP-dependent aminotransferase family protein [bacterium]|nr:PLP-dependent aminotransferase family protein [bacterium]